VPSVALSAVRYVTRVLVGPEVPNNSGCYRPIALTLPPGSVVNPRFPAPVNSRAVTLRRIVDACMGALVQAVPERLTAASNGHPLMLSLGGSDDGKRFVTSIVGTGGMGARATKDGIDCIQTDTSNAMLIPVEALELDYPIRIERIALRNDSGGAGRQRGGLGLELVVRSLIDDCWVSYRGERHATQPWGVQAGHPGASSFSYIKRASGTREVIPSKRDFTLHENETLHIATSGGGGHGDPRLRDRSLVEEDLANRKVSVEHAAAEYGYTRPSG
jgi:N-methylhydantoinase B